MDTTKVKVAHEPRKPVIELKLSIADLNPKLVDGSMLYISIPAINGPILDIGTQIHLADRLGETHYELLEQHVRNVINSSLIAHLLGERIKPN